MSNLIDDLEKQLERVGPGNADLKRALQRTIDVLQYGRATTESQKFDCSACFDCERVLRLQQRVSTLQSEQHIKQTKNCPNEPCLSCDMVRTCTYPEAEPIPKPVLSVTQPRLYTPEGLSCPPPYIYTPAVMAEARIIIAAHRGGENTALIENLLFCLEHVTRKNGNLMKEYNHLQGKLERKTKVLNTMCNKQAEVIESNIDMHNRLKASKIRPCKFQVVIDGIFNCTHPDAKQVCDGECIFRVPPADGACFVVK